MAQTQTPPSLASLIVSMPFVRGTTIYAIFVFGAMLIGILVMGLDVVLNPVTSQELNALKTTTPTPIRLSLSQTALTGAPIKKISPSGKAKIRSAASDRTASIAAQSTTAQELSYPEALRTTTLEVAPQTKTDVLIRSEVSSTLGGSPVAEVSSTLEVSPVAISRRENTDSDRRNTMGILNSNVASPPRVIYKPTPSYTTEAKEKHIEGDVSLKIRVTALGAVEILEVVSGVGYGLNESAKEAIMGTKFRPAIDATGKAVDWVGTVVVKFRLS